jgi:hypothetical protein
MPEPISSSSSVPWTPAYEEPPPEEPAVCKDPYEDVGPLAEYAEPPAPPTDNNAQRTTARRSTSPYADAGVTSSGDSVYVGGAGIKTHEPTSQTDLEVGSVSVQLGAQSEAQLAMARIGDPYGKVTGGVEVFTARAQLGIHNDDGSTGFNAGLGATAVGAETTYTFDGGNTLTVGAAASLGISGSIGLRDADGDGVDELCARYSGAIFTLGICAEP